MTDDIDTLPSAPGAETTPRHLAPGEVGLVAPRDFIYSHPFSFRSGQSISGFQLRYETYGTLEQAFAAVEAETLIVGFTSDWLFPPEQNRQLTLALLRAGKRASYAELSTDLGHDSFLLESEELYGLVRGWIERDQPYVFDYAI